MSSFYNTWWGWSQEWEVVLLAASGAAALLWLGNRLCFSSHRGMFAVKVGPSSQEDPTRVSGLPSACLGKHRSSSQASSLSMLLMFGKRSGPDTRLAWKVPSGDEQGFMLPCSISSGFWWQPLWLPGMATYPLLSRAHSLPSWPWGTPAGRVEQLGCLK